MPQKINITIPNPCHENWQAMTAAEKGRFCSSCQKNVFDFTNASDRQIIDAYHQNNNLCGRFLNTQLNRDLVKSKEKSPIWLAAASVVLSFFASHEAIAQGKPIMVQTDVKTVSQNTQNEAASLEKEISGVVTDSLGPLPGCTIIIKDTEVGTQTDFEGKFSIKAKEGDILVFSFIGMTDQQLPIGNASFYNIKMKDAPMVLLGGAIMYCKPKTFFGRIFHRIGNLFR